MKFGGTSLSSASKMKNAARILQKFSSSNKIVAVASAIGKTTDQLAEIGELAKSGELRKARKILSKVQASHRKIVPLIAGKTGTRETLDRIERLNSELQRTIEGIAHLRELTPRSRDYLLSFGERLSTPILAATAAAAGLKVRSFT